MQVINSNNPVAALDVSVDGGNTWQTTVRRDYNYFEKSSSDGFGSNTVTVRVRCSNGNQIIVQNVGQGSETSYQATGNC